MTRFAAFLLYLLAALVARLPWRWLAGLSRRLADLAIGRASRESRIALRNLELVQPDAPAVQHGLLRREVMHSTVLQVFETLRLWTRPHADNLALIREAHGVEHLDAALAAGRGVIVAAPHFGNWELLNQWLASRTPLAILYAPPESAVGEAFLNRVRADDDAGRITQVRADGAGVRQLFKRLAAGGVVGILPDQQPKRGDGEFAPFFGIEALTMTLLGRLAARSGATVLMAWCERIDGDGDRPAFALHVEPAPAAVSDPDPKASATALNAAVERIARRDPAQYQWTYKRFSLRPPDSGEQNPYWPDCY
ncbi:lipid A biosynthesis lauroyl acyltransferase [Lysobacter arseniciresistens ZS79]|uniref:Lipid A biosynthesis lauroyl acyltransferase n=1 Tax=Lysobacter arseniciresistens ZS79 TaxID=913325 RepID=A0A0A0EUR9_9GAMM|nr:lauroyl acyltransferase [Lysobacter arseniciresistens]KGM54696.1 lipid A biosynthesis lauroyl acyltransferase [Lysobacter arseniciresistens ZS79]